MAKERGMRARCLRAGVPVREVEVPHPLRVTPRSMAGFRFRDGSLLEACVSGRYAIRDAWGDVVDEGEDFLPWPADHHCGHVVSRLASHLLHDAAMWAAGEMDSDMYVFLDKFVGEWAHGRASELEGLSRMWPRPDGGAKY
jgi:hypothetical protein